jgi:MFS transporter, putative metabolite:H+ symporter
MTTSTNVGARLDRLPVGPFHYGIFWLVGAGMFFDGYDLYVGTNVLPALLQSRFSTLDLNAVFVSITFLGIPSGRLSPASSATDSDGASPTRSTSRSSA